MLPIGSDFVPYVPPEQTIPELTIKALVLGAILSVVMAAANAYLGLYAGMTVSATIPAAVIALAVFKALARTGKISQATILETNLSKTMASAGESLAAGVIFTIPALLVMGLWDNVDYTKTTMIALTGGMLGVLFTISLRRILIIDLDLPYPEGVACSEVLKVGEEGGKGVNLVFGGLGLAALYKFVATQFGGNLWQGHAMGTMSLGKFKFFGGGDLSPALLSVGYIVGLRIASYIFMGGFIGWVILAPIIGAYNDWTFNGTSAEGIAAFMGDGLTHGGVWGEYIRYIGVGAMVVGGVYTLFSMRDAITKGLKQAFSGFGGDGDEHIPRTEHDLPLKLAWFASFALIIPIFGIYLWVSESLLIASVSAVVMFIAAFFFTAIAGYIAGVVGSSNNPISGVTIATLLFAAILLVGLGAEGTSGMQTTILIAALVCCAAAIAGDVMQDLKTGQILGSTPRHLQVGEFIGVGAAALIIAPVLMVLHEAYVIGSPQLRAPQAGLMSAVTEGVFQGGLPWNMVFIGMVIAVILILLKVPVMAVAIGIYLPFTLATPIMLGGVIRHFCEKFIENKTRKEKMLSMTQEDLDKEIANEKELVGRNGLLLGSGLIAGEALMGVGIAVLVVMSIDINSGVHASMYAGIPVFFYFAFLLVYVSLRDRIHGMSLSEILYFMRKR